MSNIKVLEKIGDYPGKNIVILAGVHGNEKFAVEVLEKYSRNLEIKNGKLTIIFANIEAIKQGKRFIEFNLNRCFLKEQTKEIYNSFEGKTAREIMPFLNKADVVLDLHASNTPNTRPFIICEKQSFEIAKKLPFEIISYNWDKFQPGSSDYYMNLQNKIGICAECGHIDDKTNKEKAEQVIDNFLTATGSINGKIKTNANKKFIKIAAQYKNKYGKFKKSRDFKDFEILDKNEFVGKDGNKKVYAKNGEMLLFVRDRENIGEECFLIAKEESPD